jgi:hypothetical protein
MTNHQRVGSPSNTFAGREFENWSREYFAKRERLHLVPALPVALGHGGSKKMHRFDLGSLDPAVLVECKSHNWTATGNMPSAKVTVWNEAMYYFHLAPAKFRKILFVVESRHDRQSETLGEFYVRTRTHLIPKGVSILEYNPENMQARYIYGSAA